VLFKKFKIGYFIYLNICIVVFFFRAFVRLYCQCHVFKQHLRCYLQDWSLLGFPDDIDNYACNNNFSYRRILGYCRDNACVRRYRRCQFQRCWPTCVQKFVFNF